MKKFSTSLILISVLFPMQMAQAESSVLRTATGFYYPANMKHSDPKNSYLAYSDKNPFFANRCHLASDYKLAEGSAIYAVGEGVVEQASMTVPFYGSDSGAQGGAMIVKHKTKNNETFYVLYGHIKAFKVAVGDTVAGGQKIAEVGPFVSGVRSLPHLHFGVNASLPSYEGYTPTSQCSDYLGYVDPETYITTKSAKVVAAETCKAVDDAASTTKNTVVTVASVLGNDTDSDGDTLSVSGADANSAQGVVITNNSDGTFTYTPPIDYTGTDSFNYTVTDSNGCSDTGEVTVTISAGTTTPSTPNPSTPNPSTPSPSTPTSSSSGGGSFGFAGVLSMLSLCLMRAFRRRKYFQ